MKWIKFILILLALGVGVYLIFWLIGIVGTILWYLFWMALLGAGGFVAYKFFVEKDAPEQLEEKTVIQISEMRDTDRVLEEYKRRELER